MAFGYHGKILRVNLSTGGIAVETPDENFYRTYYGGRGLVAYYLLKELGRNVDPLGPENILIFAAGPVTGAPFAGSGRNSVGAKSPLTGAYGDGEGGGFFGAELKRAGWDAIIVQGRAEKPVYLWINDDNVEIRDASHIWGKETADAQDIIRQELGDNTIRTAQCGIAGENLVRFAAVCNDLKHFVGRSGMGAVMGSKKLRAVAVKGTKGVPVVDPDVIRDQARWLAENVHEVAGGMYDCGTANGLMNLHGSGGLPTRNFNQGQFEGAEKISGQTMRDTILVAREGCFACPIRCKRAVKVEGRYQVDPKYGGPEYETLGALGSTCGVDDLEAIARGNQQCGAYSLDTISTGGTIAFAMECFENGIITKEDTGGIDLAFGNADAMLQMIEKIAHREGIGAVLAEGTKRAAAVFGKGAEQFAMQIKGQEIPMHEPRLKMALGVGYAVSPTGADHCHNYHDTMFSKAGKSLDEFKALGMLEPLPADLLDGAKVRYMTYVTLQRNIANCLVYCQFVPWWPDRLLALTRAVTGWNTSLFELMNVSRRAFTLTRIFNLRQGFTDKDDYLNDRFFKPFDSGPTAGVQIDREQFEKAKKLHYGMMGWNERGVPTEATLEELGIGWAKDYVPK